MVSFIMSWCLITLFIQRIRTHVSEFQIYLNFAGFVLFADKVREREELGDREEGGWDRINRKVEPRKFGFTDGFTQYWNVRGMKGGGRTLEVAGQLGGRKFPSQLCYRTLQLWNCDFWFSAFPYLHCPIYLVIKELQQWNVFSYNTER